MPTERTFTRHELDVGKFPHERQPPIILPEGRYTRTQKTQLPGDFLIITDDVTWTTLIRTARRAMQNRDRLAKYVLHLPECAVKQVLMMPLPTPQPCTCGLDKELAYLKEDRS